ncbi:MAG: BlaI/MecI/CopY family transcriptional regulator [Acidimicrobiia bacterium]|nr:BlaI/MecI/CopY family transcriptional regulator [Acidimicrobiia bacterium]
MAVLWDQPGATVADVVAALRKTRPVTYSTVQTMLRILEAKGYVQHEKIGRAFHFRPIVGEQQARQSALRHLVDRLFSGSPSLLVLNVLDDERLDAAELKRLKKLIEKA